MDCISIPELDTSKWGERLLAPLKGGRYPLGASIELTERCNLSCVHCYINQPAGDCYAKTRELDTVQFKSVLDKMADHGTLFLLMTGGEPLIRKDFKELYLHAVKQGMLVTLFTNGTLMTGEIADLLVDYPPFGIEITLYGATRETYESVTMIPGSYDRCLKGIEIILDRNLPLALKSMLLKENYHELEGMRSLAESYGLDFRYDGVIWPRNDGDHEPEDHRLSVSELIEIERRDPKRIEQWQKYTERFGSQVIRKNRVFTCGGGVHSYHVNSLGQMMLCLMVRHPAFDLLEMDFKEAWEGIGELRKMQRTMHTECETCIVGGFCSQCPGWSYISHGDYETPVDFVCRLGKRRADLILENNSIVL